jgi:hypothetical protein
MKCICKYCSEEYDVSDWKALTVDAHKQDDNDILGDTDGDTDISPYSMEVVLTPGRNLMGEYCGDFRRDIFSEYHTDMCNACVQEFIAYLQKKIGKWKKEKIGK